MTRSSLRWRQPPRTDRSARGAFRSVSAGYFHACGLRADDTVTCWGLLQDQAYAVPDGAFTAVTAGLLATCGLRPDQTVECWLSLPDGVLPAHTKNQNPTPNAP